MFRSEIACALTSFSITALNITAMLRRAMLSKVEAQEVGSLFFCPGDDTEQHSFLDADMCLSPKHHITNATRDS